MSLYSSLCCHKAANLLQFIFAKRLIITTIIMKPTSKLILTSLFVSVLLSIPTVSSNAQNGNAVFASYKPAKQKGVEIPKRLERKFRRDAARLALRLTAEQEDLRYQSISIPRNNIETFYSVLSNIYVNDQTAQSIANCNVHTFPDPSIDRFIVIFDKSVAWAEPLQMGISETDSDEINELLDQYDLVLDKHVQWNDTQDAITIRSKEPLNMAALANEFYNVKGVAEIDLGIPDVGGNDIQIHRIEAGWTVQYILRFGSQITGNGKQHIWIYQANDSGEIKLVKEDGAPIPEWMRCELKLPNGMMINKI
ncbi:MAG: hypothetical protein ACI85O_001700 [Saprospiraceae bacterium]|jgi:hypothetical protein